MTQADTARPRRERDPFEDLVVADAFDNTTEQEAASLRADDSVVLFDETLRALIGKISGQLAADNTRPDAERNPDWRRRTLAIQGRLQYRLREIAPLAAIVRRRQNGDRDA